MKRALWIVAGLLASALPAFTKNPYYLDVITGAFVVAIAVYGMNVMLGFGGLLNLGNAGFVGIGAYAVALLETRAGWLFWPALVAGIVASAALGALVGAISLRTRGHYFAILTAAIGVMINVVLANWQEFTGGNIGIAAIPPPPTLGALAFDGPIPKYFLVLAALAIAIGTTAALRRSLFGRTLVAVAQNESLARAIGVDVTRVRLQAFIVSTALAGLSGGMFAMHVGFLGPNIAGIDVTFDQTLYLIVGGLGTVAGPLVGTVLLIGLTQVLQGIEHYRFLIFGPLLVVLVMFFPRGIVGMAQHFFATRRTARPLVATVGTEEALSP